MNYCVTELPYLTKCQPRSRTTRRRPTGKDLGPFLFEPDDRSWSFGPAQRRVAPGAKITRSSDNMNLAMFYPSGQSYRSQFPVMLVSHILLAWPI